MSQSSPTIGANKSGLTYRQEDNEGKSALLSHHKGSTAPSYAEAGVIWLDDASTPWLLKLHDGSDWITMGAIHATNNTFQPFLGTEGLKTLPFVADTGSADTYVLAPSPAITAYSTGQMVILKPSHTNTGTSTLSLNGLSAKNIKMPDGSNTPADVLIADQIYILIYDGTDFIATNAYAEGILPDGNVVQSVSASYTSSGTMSVSIPYDDTIPQKTEGTEILSASITPQTTTNKLRVTIQGMCGRNTAGHIITGLFQDDITDAIAVTSVTIDDSSHTAHNHLVYEFCPATTSSVTLKCRVGPTSGYCRFNASGSGSLFGGILATTMTIEEIKTS